MAIAGVVPMFLNPAYLNSTAPLIGTAEIISDFVYPDFTDPNSKSGNFWTGLYENASAGWEKVKGVGDKVTDWSVQRYEESETDIQARKALAVENAERFMNRLSGLGPYTRKEYDIQMALALETARTMDLDGAFVFSVGSGPIQGITRFGELSGFGEERNDIFELLANPVGSFVKFGSEYLKNVFSTDDAVPHHVGMARLESSRMPGGSYVNYVMQINPEGETKVFIEDFARGNLQIMIIMPRTGAKASAELWDKGGFHPITGVSVSGRSYDYLRLIGWGDESERGSRKAICSEDAYFRRMDWANQEGIDPLPGVKLDGRITPWDEYESRHIWDEDMVKLYRKTYADAAKRIENAILREE